MPSLITEQTWSAPSGGRTSLTIRRMSINGLMILLSFLCVFPIYWIFFITLKTAYEIFSTALWPSHPSLENYAYVFAKMPILRILANTVIVAATTAGLQVLTGLLAAYALVYWRLRLGGFVHGLIALSWLVPFQVTMIPNYVF